ncbi:MAG: transglutaminase family protein, partial [Verrucomicrobiota bacterium]
RVAGICNWIHTHIDDEPGSTDAHTSAVECLTLRAGVCRDFAHLGVAFCRALGIPARYGSAYAYKLPQPDFHAFFEVWLGGRWWYYDATRMAPQQGFIWVGSGHDAADTSVATMSASVQFESMEIRVDKRSPGKVRYAAGPVGF